MANYFKGSAYLWLPLEMKVILENRKIKIVFLNIVESKRQGLCSLSSEIGFIATIYDVCIFQDELEALRADVERYNEVIEYLRYFVRKIEEMLKYQENLYINSDDILEHLRSNKKDSLMLKNIARILWKIGSIIKSL